MTMRRGRGSGEGRPTWIQPLMEWSSIQKVKARLKGPLDRVPAAVGNVTLSNAGRQARLRRLHEQPCGIVLVRDVFSKEGARFPCEFMTLPIAPGPDGKKRIIGTIVPAVHVEEWTADLIFDRILTLRRAVYFDTGAGVPPSSLGIEV